MERKDTLQRTLKPLNWEDHIWSYKTEVTKPLSDRHNFNYILGKLNSQKLRFCNSNTKLNGVQ